MAQRQVLPTMCTECTDEGPSLQHAATGHTKITAKVCVTKTKYTLNYIKDFPYKSFKFLSFSKCFKLSLIQVKMCLIYSCHLDGKINSAVYLLECSISLAY